uniref:SCP domain-containing protein n=1 Tax=Trichobilharzia regenti TaxID=157069 RepID=A0AA85J5D0_TRIRE|nr:unnamed protein product [Trichobilharzia regenti]
MPPLLQAWDEKLSSQAKTSSETRRTGFCHPKSSKLYSDAQYIGANPIVEQAMEAWFGHHKSYNFINNLYNYQCRRYMQSKS